MDDEQVQDQQVDPALNETDDAVQLTNDETPDVPAEVSEAPVATESVEETDSEDDEDYAPITVNVPELTGPALDFNSLPADENGNIDAAALAQALQQRDQTILQQAAAMVREQEERRQEERQWNKAFEKYPDLKKDKALAEEVQALRFGLFAKDINSGKESKLITPSQAYERINKRFAAQRIEGVRQATENTRIEESVYVEPTSNARTTSEAGEDQLFRQMRSPDRVEADKAGFDFLKKRLFG